MCPNPTTRGEWEMQGNDTRVTSVPAPLEDPCSRHPAPSPGHVTLRKCTGGMKGSGSSGFKMKQEARLDPPHLRRKTGTSSSTLAQSTLRTMVLSCPDPRHQRGLIWGCPRGPGVSTCIRPQGQSTRVLEFAGIRS